MIQEIIKLKHNLIKIRVLWGEIMTYKESYMKCDSLDELKKVVESDVIMAIVSNPDRITEIEKTMNEVIEEKGWTK